MEAKKHIIYDIETKFCVGCQQDVSVDNFYKKSNGKAAGNYCKECVKKKNRLRSMSEEEVEKRRLRNINISDEHRELRRKKLDEYYRTKKGRIKSFLKTAKRKSVKFNERFDLDENYLFTLLGDCCSVTGVPFDYSKHPNYKCNPFAPSIDRIDSNVGYIKGNVRFVVWQYNMMKSELSDEELISFCERILNAAGRKY